MAVYYVEYGTAWTLRGYQLVDRNTRQYKITPRWRLGISKLRRTVAQRRT